MSLTRKKVQLIKLLLSSPTFISSYEMEQHTNIHHRLIRDEIKEIRALLLPLGILIRSKASKGYAIHSEDPRAIDQLEEEVKNFEKEIRKKTPDLPREREFYITYRLLTTQDFIKIDTLAEELFTSRSSVSNTLRQVRKTLEKSNLVIHQKPNYGLKISGAEIDCRKPLVDVYFANFTERSSFYDLLRHEDFENPIVESLIIQIIEAHGVEISDISICDFLLCVSVSILRMRLGFYLDEVEDVSDIVHSVEFEAAKEIASAVARHLDLHIPEAEVVQFGIELMSKRATTKGTAYQIEKAHLLARLSLESIHEISRIDLSGQPVLIDELVDYIQGVLFRQRFKTKLRSPLFLDVEPKYPLSYALARLISDVFVAQKHEPLSLSELSYFTIILNTTLQRNFLTPKNVLLISGLSPATTQLIVWQINYRFGNEIIITNSTQYYRLRHLDLSEYDLIISTLPIHAPLPIPTLHINPIVEDEDFNTISKYLARHFQHQNLNLYSCPNLFKNGSIIENNTEILPAFYRLFSENLVLQDDSLKTALNKKQGISIHEYNQLITVIKYNRAINNNSTIATIINDHPLRVDQMQGQIFIFIAFKSTDEHLATSAMNVVMQLSEQEELVAHLLANPTYPNLIQAIKTVSEKSE